MGYFVIWTNTAASMLIQVINIDNWTKITIEKLQLKKRITNVPLPLTIIKKMVKISSLQRMQFCDAKICKPNCYASFGLLSIFGSILIKKMIILEFKYKHERYLIVIFRGCENTKWIQNGSCGYSKDDKWIVSYLKATRMQWIAFHDMDFISSNENANWNHWKNNVAATTSTTTSRRAKKEKKATPQQRCTFTIIQIFFIILLRFFIVRRKYFISAFDRR